MHPGVTFAYLAGHDVVGADGVGGLPHPLLRLRVWAHQQGLIALPGDEATDQWRGTEADGPLCRYGRAQVGDPVQVGIHGDQCIAELGEKAADNGLADRLSGHEFLVLAHIAEIGRDQDDLTRTQMPGRFRRQQQLDQFLVGAIEAAEQDDAFRDCLGQAQQALLVGKGMDLDGHAGQLQGPGQGLRLRQGVGEGKDQHQDSTKPGGMSWASPTW